MECVSTNPHLVVLADTVNKIRKLHNIDTPERLKETLDLLEDWVQKQTHFVKRDFEREYLEKCYVSSKGSVENAKIQLDRTCTMKTILPKYFEKTNVREELIHLTELARIVPLPNIINDYYRVVLIQFNVKEIQPRNFMEYYQYIIIMCEYLKKCDYINGLVVVQDYRNMNITELITKINTVELQEFTSIITKAYGARFQNIYFLSESKSMEFFLNIVKKFLSDKISSRINIVPNLDELYKCVPKEVLPKDYGGNEKSTDALISEWIEILSTKEHVEYMEMMKKASTHESQRLTGKFNQDYMGMPGSFRNLSVD